MLVFMAFFTLHLAEVPVKAQTAVSAAAPALNKSKATLYVLDTLQLKVKGAKTVKWKSSNSKVAAVTKNGLVKAKKAGTAKITATVGRKKLVCRITVKKLSLNKKKANLMAGEKLQLKVKKTGNKITWKSSDKAVATVSGKGKVTAKAGGTATISATVKTGVGKKTLKCKLTVSEPDAVLAPDVSPLTQDEAKTFEDSVLNISATEIQEDYGSSRKYDLTIDKNSGFGQRITKGTVKEGDVFVIPPDEVYLTGLTFRIETIEQKDDVCVIHARQPEIDELFGENGSIDYSCGAAEADPLAFVIGGDGSIYSGEALGNALSGGILYNGNEMISGEQDIFTRNLFPLGVPISPSVHVNGNGTFEVGLSMQDVILYDEDKVGTTSEDQILMDVECTASNIRFDGRTAWESGLPEQVSFGLSYDMKQKLAVKMQKGFKLSDVMKKAGITFENSSSTLVSELSGVKMDGKIFLGAVGIRGGRPFIAKGLDGVVSIDPVFFLAFYINVDGSVSGEGSFGMTCESYKEEGFSLYDKRARNVINNYAFDETKQIGSDYELGTWSRETVSRTDKSDPQWKTEVALDGKLTLGLGAGVMGGVSVLNIIPGDVYAQAGVSAAGVVHGSISELTKETALNRRFKCEGKAAIDCRAGIDLGAEFAVSLRIFDKWGLFYNIPVGLEASAKKEFEIASFHAEYPGAVMTGVIYDCDIDQACAHYVVPNTEVCVFRRDLLEKDGIEKVKDEKTGKMTWPVSVLNMRMEDFHATSGEDGKYFIEHLPKGQYVLQLRRTDYHPYVTEFEVISDKEGFAADITQDYYFRQNNWLDELSPTFRGDAGSLAKDAKVCDGSDKDKHFKISGVNYTPCFYLDSGNQGDSGSMDAVWKLDGKYDSLDVRIGLVDKTSPLPARLDIYLASTEEGLYAEGIEPSQTISLSQWDVSRVYTINFYGSLYARFALTKTGWNNWAQAEYAFVEGIWHPSPGTTVTYNTIRMKDPFEYTDFGAPDFLNVCAPFRGVDHKLYYADGTKTFKMNGTAYNNGFVLSSHSVSDWGNGKVIFNTDGKFSALTLDVGFVSYIAKSKFHVYLDGEEEPSQTYELTKDTVSTVTIPINYAKSVRIQIDNHNDNWATDSVGFANGVWSY